MFSKNKHSATSKQKIKPRKSSGASRRAQQNPLNVVRSVFVRFLKVCTVGAVLAGSVFAVNALNIGEKWNNFYQKPITEVQIDGEFLYLSQELVRKQVGEVVSANFLSTDLQLLKQNLEGHPWVDTVSVTRKWPGKLVVYVVEQQPIARWGTDGFLNMRGDIIRTEHAVDLKTLPLLSGEDQYATEVMQEYLRMGKLLAQAELVLEAVDLDKTRAWTLIVDDNVTIKLGRDLVWDKLQYIAAAKRTVLATKFLHIASIDMRYHNGMAVEWKTSFSAPAIAKQ